MAFNSAPLFDQFDRATINCHVACASQGIWSSNARRGRKSRQEPIRASENETFNCQPRWFRNSRRAATAAGLRLRAQWRGGSSSLPVGVGCSSNSKILARLELICVSVAVVVVRSPNPCHSRRPKISIASQGDLRSIACAGSGDPRTIEGRLSRASPAVFVLRYRWLA